MLDSPLEEQRITSLEPLLSSIPPNLSHSDFQVSKGCTWEDSRPGWTILFLQRNKLDVEHPVHGQLNRARPPPLPQQGTLDMNLEPELAKAQSLGQWECSSPSQQKLRVSMEPDSLESQDYISDSAIEEGELSVDETQESCLFPP